MNLVTVKELYKTPEAYLDKEITIGGWIRSLRDSKAFGFIVVSDGSYFEPLQQAERGHRRDRHRYPGCHAPGQAAL